jgi:hypothetical protein
MFMQLQATPASIAKRTPEPKVSHCAAHDHPHEAGFIYSTCAARPRTAHRSGQLVEVKVQTSNPSPDRCEFNLYGSMQETGNRPDVVTASP